MKDNFFPCGNEGVVPSGENRYRKSTHVVASLGTRGRADEGPRCWASGGVVATRGQLGHVASTGQRTSASDTLRPSWSPSLSGSPCWAGSTRPRPRSWGAVLHTTVNLDTGGCPLVSGRQAGHFILQLTPSNTPSFALALTSLSIPAGPEHLPGCKEPLSSEPRNRRKGSPSLPPGENQLIQRNTEIWSPWGWLVPGAHSQSHAKGSLRSDTGKQGDGQVGQFVPCKKSDQKDIVTCHKHYFFAARQQSNQKGGSWDKKSYS